MRNKKSIGLPNGPNEFLKDITQYISVEGYKRYSDDVNNPINIIQSGSITMEDVDFPVKGIDNLGNEEIMMPGMNYQFPGDSVLEVPMAQVGKEIKTGRGTPGLLDKPYLDPGNINLIYDEDEVYESVFDPRVRESRRANKLAKEEYERKVQKRNKDIKSIEEAKALYRNVWYDDFKDTTFKTSAERKEWQENNPRWKAATDTLGRYAAAPKGLNPSVSNASGFQHTPYFNPEADLTDLYPEKPLLKLPYPDIKYNLSNLPEGVDETEFRKWVNYYYPDYAVENDISSTTPSEKENDFIKSAWYELGNQYEPFKKLEIKKLEQPALKDKPQLSNFTETKSKSKGTLVSTRNGDGRVNVIDLDTGGGFGTYDTPEQARIAMIEAYTDGYSLNNPEIANISAEDLGNLYDVADKQPAYRANNRPLTNYEKIQAMKRKMSEGGQYQIGGEQPTLSAYEEPAWYEKAVDYLASPMTALGYLATGQDLPDNLPINMEETNVYDMVIDMINPVAMAKYVAQAKRDYDNEEYLNAGLNTLGALPVPSAILAKGKKLLPPKAIGAIDDAIKSAYKYNPVAYNNIDSKLPEILQFNRENNSWLRQVGKPAIDDIKQTGVVRELNEVIDPKLFDEKLQALRDQQPGIGFSLDKRYNGPFFKKGETFFDYNKKSIPKYEGRTNTRGKSGSSDYLIETKPSVTDDLFQPAYNQVMYPDALKSAKDVGDVAIMKPISREADNFNFYKKDWWQGYKRTPLDELQKGGEHTVSEGETFYGIANKNGLSWQDLEAFNPNIDIDALKKGQIINLSAPSVKPTETKKSTEEKREPTSWYDYINPYNWGVSDRDDDGDFKQAFRAAREAGEDEFIWYGERYTTELDETVVPKEKELVKKEVNNYSIKEYQDDLKGQENLSMKGWDPKKQLWFPTPAPEKNGGYDIGYGHKIKKGENFSKGLTNDQVNNLFKRDIDTKFKAAKSTFNNRNLSRSWDELDQQEQILLTDYQYNGVLHDFKKFMKAVADKDKDLMLKEYVRYDDGVPLGKRNDWTKSYINSKINYKKGGEPNPLTIYSNYINGDYDGTDLENKAIKIYDKLNRIHYRDAKSLGMSPVNYILTHVVAKA